MKRFFSYLGLLSAIATILISCAQVNSPATPQLNSLKVGFSAWPGWLPWQVAAQTQRLPVQPAKAQMQWFDSYLESLKAMKSGQIQANSQTLSDTIAAVAAGSDQVIVLVNDNSIGNDKVIVRPGIEKIQDLRGKRVAVEKGTVDYFLLMVGLKQVGLSVHDVDIINLETSQAAAAFASGQVDATAVFAPFTTQALKRPGARELFSSKDYPGAISDHLVVPRSLIEQQPQTVQALVNSWFQTLEHIQKNQARSLEIMAKRAGVSLADYKQYTQGIKIFTVEDNLKAFYPAAEMDSLSFMASKVSDYMVLTGLVEEAPKLDGLFDDRFVKAYAAQAKPA
jgi:NitT/TauT family transport system substrate-binding protein